MPANKSILSRAGTRQGRAGTRQGRAGTRQGRAGQARGRAGQARGRAGQGRAGTRQGRAGQGRHEAGQGRHEAGQGRAGQALFKLFLSKSTLERTIELLHFYWFSFYYTQFLKTPSFGMFGVPNIQQYA
jgi:hypothetical protein